MYWQSNFDGIFTNFTTEFCHTVFNSRSVWDWTLWRDQELIFVKNAIWPYMYIQKQETIKTDLVFDFSFGPFSMWLDVIFCKHFFSFQLDQIFEFCLLRQDPLDLSFWSFLTFLHHSVEKVETHLLWKFYKKFEGKVGQMCHRSCSLA